MSDLLRVGFSLLIFASSIAPAFASNDWNTPCFNGVCLYSLTAAPGQNGSGTMQIWGSPNALSDITPAAGWQILDCSPTEMVQDIRLVCMSNDTETAGCDHLFQAEGAEGKLVRLPEDCGMSPFARVVKSYIPSDQSIPSNISARFVRRDGNSSLPQVQALSLDINFAAVDPSKYGNLNIAIQGANYPGADVNGTLVSTTTPSPRWSELEDRGLLGDIGSAIDSAGSSIGNAISSANSFNVSKTDALPPINVDKSATLFNKNITCGDVELSVNVGVSGQANAQASIGIIAQGTIVPPSLTEFSAIVGLNGNIDGSLDLNAGVDATFTTGMIEIFTVGIPGLDFPGILTIGPTFDVNVEATAELDLAVDLNVGLVYNISNAQLVFPDPNNQSGGDFTVGDTPLTLSLTPSVTATGSLTAHLIPSINLGVSALDNIASANIFLNLDASATLQLSLDAVDSNSITIANDTSSSTADSTSSDSVSTTSSGTSSPPPSDSPASSVLARNYFGERSTTTKPTSIVRAIFAAKKASGAPKKQSSSDPDPEAEPASEGTTKSTVKTAKSTSTSGPSQSLASDLSSASTTAAASTTVAASITVAASTSTSITASASGSVSGSDSSTSTSDPTTSTIAAGNLTAAGDAINSAVTSNISSSVISTSTISVSTSTSSSSIPASTPLSSSSSGVQFGGCVEIDTGLTVNAGASGSFFDIFSDSTEVPLFSKEFVLFQKCFGNGASASRRSILHSESPSQLYHRATESAPVADNDSAASNSLSCLSGSPAAPAPIADGVTVDGDTVAEKSD